MLPFHQGQLDVFCAIYAVLNALRLLRDIRPLAARAILHDTLYKLAADPKLFRQVLEQETDYYDLIDELLAKQARKLCLHAETPFPDRDAVAAEPEELWECMRRWLSRRQASVVLLRFIRFMPFDGRPYIRHWTCARAIENQAIQLFDSSLTEGSIHAIRRKELITDPRFAHSDRVLIEPASLRLLSL